MKVKVIFAIALLVTVSGFAYAELQNVQVGGSIRVRASLTDNFGFDEDFNNDSFVEQRTRVNVQADFTQDVKAFIELQSYNIWGDDFPSTTSTSLGGFEINEFGNGRNDAGDVDLYQAYIKADNIGLTHLALKIGRQEIVEGREWILGKNDANSFFPGLSYDAVKLTYDNPDVNFKADAFWAKLAEMRFLEEDADTDLYGVYLTWKPVEHLAGDLYWVYVRDAKDVLNAATNLLVSGGFQDDTDEFHTVGLRLYGECSGFDYNAEAAFQFGDAEIGQHRRWWFNDDSGDYEGWGVDLQAGYTFENVAWSPRVGLGYTFFSGDEDLMDDDVEAFNRVFSNVEYGVILDGGELSNVHIIQANVKARPLEKVGIGLDYYYYIADEDDIKTTNDIGFFGFPLLSIPVELETDDKIGQEVDLWATYDYSEDLHFKAGWSHLFTGEGIEEGTLVTGNGQFGFASGNDDDDVDYLYLEASLEF